MSHRLFLAVPVTLYRYDAIRKTFTPVLEGSWRDEETLHATVLFLDDIFKPETLIDKLNDFDWSFEPSEFTSFDYFNRSRVFVMTCKNHSLQNLYDRLTIRLGLRQETLTPHVTMMRVKKILDPLSFTDLMSTSADTPIGRMQSKIALYESRLYQSGARYTILKEWKI